MSFGGQEQNPYISGGGRPFSAAVAVRGMVTNGFQPGVRPQQRHILQAAHTQNSGLQDHQHRLEIYELDD